MDKKNNLFFTNQIVLTKLRTCFVGQCNLSFLNPVKRQMMLVFHLSQCAFLQAYLSSFPWVVSAFCLYRLR